MVIGTGVDIVNIDRFRKTVKKNGDKFLKRVFTKEELDYCNKKMHRFQHLAGRFASKEAISKALKIDWNNGFNWKEIKIFINGNGAPKVKLIGKARLICEDLKIDGIDLSISHCDDYAVAMAVVTGSNNNGTNTRVSLREY